MNTTSIQVKGFTYDLDLQRDVLRKIEIVLENDVPPIIYEQIHFDRDHVFEFYSAWKNINNAEEAYTDHLKLADDAYIEFKVIDEFEGSVALVIERGNKIRVDLPIFFMEFESLIYEMLEEELAYEYAE